jgi:hypothetical protein
MKNKLILKWAILCAGTSVDQRNNNVTLFNLIEELKIKKDVIPKLPVKKEGHSVLPVHMELAVCWSREDVGTALLFEVLVSFISPKGRVIARMINPTEIASDKLRTRLILGIEALGIEEEGNYKFEIKAKLKGDPNFKKYSEVPLLIKFKD